MPAPAKSAAARTKGSGNWRRKQKPPCAASAAAAAAAAPRGPSQGGQRGLEIRQVWADNVEREFALIRAAVEHLPYVSMDTEFPGVIHLPAKDRHPNTLTPSERYSLVKANVDALHLIQVGLTFAASPSSPPALAFEINLCDFDPRVHRHAPESLRLLEANGVDLAANRARGVPGSTLAAFLLSSGLLMGNASRLRKFTCSEITWVTFHSAYDFAYLVKLLVGRRKLPRSLPDFLRCVRVFFGDRVIDVKHVMRYCAGLYGGLDRVAATLGVQRAAGRSHQAGSDSVLTWDIFRRINRIYFPSTNDSQGLVTMRSFAGVLFGLEMPITGNSPMAAPKETSTKMGVAAPPCIASVV